MAPLDAGQFASESNGSIGATLMVTWMQIMAEVRSLGDKQERGDRLSEDDAARLVAMLLDFHNQAVIKEPVPSRPIAVPR